jgi:cyclic pyranopterin phosphate synthase
VDVSGRDETPRRAVAEGFLVADPDTIRAIREGRLPKAEPLATARAAALLAVKDTPRLIPHCHPIRVTAATVEFDFAVNSVQVRCEVRAVDRTGPQMEAIVGVTAALLTLYDMAKALCPTASMERVRLVEKEGGRSGHWRADGAAGKVGTVVAVCISREKGTPKDAVGHARLIEGHGVEGDSHAGTSRQVSLLCQKSADKLSDTGVDLRPGVFAENLRVAGLEAGDFRVGAIIRVGGAVLEVTEIGKECHSGKGGSGKCAIARLTGRCVMPTDGIFARVVRGGEVRAGDSLEVSTDDTQSGRAGDK